MKIIRQTSSEIVIASTEKSLVKSRWEAFANLLFANIFIVVPFYIFGNVLSLDIGSSISALTRSTKVSCDRVNPIQVNCEVIQSDFFSFGQQKKSNYQFVQGVKFNTTNRATTSFSFLTNIGEKEPLTTSSATAYAIVDPVNFFVKSKQKSFSYTSDNSFNYSNAFNYFSLGFFVFCALFGLPLLWSALASPFRKDQILLDKLESKFEYTQKSIFGSKINQYQFTDIAKIDVVYSTDSYQNVFFDPRITMRSGQKYMLETMRDRQAAIDLANGLNRFVYLPEESDPVVKK
jgi:hypothetical protein